MAAKVGWSFSNQKCVADIEEWSWEQKPEKYFRFRRKHSRNSTLFDIWNKVQGEENWIFQWSKLEFRLMFQNPRVSEFLNWKFSELTHYRNHLSVTVSKKSWGKNFENFEDCSEKTFNRTFISVSISISVSVEMGFLFLIIASLKFKCNSKSFNYRAAKPFCSLYVSMKRSVCSFQNLGVFKVGQNVFERQYFTLFLRYSRI